MPSDKAGRVVFIGNIPYGLTEEQITDIFSQAGRILNFRIVYDKETGKPKGFGFAEFADQDAAASAVRNLNNHEVMGRTLRVDYSKEGDADGNASHITSGHQHNNSRENNVNPSPSTLPSLPPGTDLPAGLTCPDAISRTLNTLPPPQLLDILSQMKGVVMSDPNKATELLRQAPQLSYAIFQCLLLLGLVDTSILASVVGQSAAPPPQPQVHNPPPMPMHQGFPPPPMPPHMLQQPNMPTPPMYGQPPPQPPPIPQQQQQPTQDKLALIQQVMSMTDDVLNGYPPETRQQLLNVRQAVREGRY